MKIQFELIIDNKLAALCRKIFTVKSMVFLVAVCLFAFGLFLFSEPITKPYTFASETVISSAEVNQNFDALYTLINQHDNSISSLVEGGDGFWLGDASNISYMGNVGIGTSTPATALDVEGTVTATALDVGGTVTATALDVGGIVTATALDVEGTVTATAFVGNGSGLSGVTVSTNTLRALDGTPAQAVYVDAAGDVGIGTTSPDERLHVVGNIKASGSIYTKSGFTTGSSATVITSSEWAEDQIWKIYATGNPPADDTLYGEFTLFIKHSAPTGTNWYHISSLGGGTITFSYNGSDFVLTNGYSYLNWSAVRIK